MTILALLSQILWLLAFLALIWLVVRAFQRHWLWGLAVLLLSPISATIFGIKYWRKEKTPFLAYITTFFAAVTIGLYVFSSLGGWDVVQNSLNVGEGMHSESLSEKDALAFIRSNLNFIDNAVTDEEEQKKVDVMRKFLNKFESGMMSEEDIAELNQEMLDLAATQDLTDEQRRQLDELKKQLLLPDQTSSDGNLDETSQHSSDNTTATSINKQNSKSRSRDRMRLVSIDASEADNYIGNTFKVRSPSGVDRTYRLVASSPSSLRFERREQGGVLTFEVEKRKIRGLKVFTRETSR